MKRGEIIKLLEREQARWSRQQRGTSICRATAMLLQVPHVPEQERTNLGEMCTAIQSRLDAVPLENAPEDVDLMAALTQSAQAARSAGQGTLVRTAEIMVELIKCRLATQTPLPSRVFGHVEFILYQAEMKKYVQSKGGGSISLPASEMQDLESKLMESEPIRLLHAIALE